jgi:hypothetical protein
MAKYITITEAAKLAGRHRQSIVSAVKQGLIHSKTINTPGVRGGKLTVVLASDVESADERRVWRAKNKISRKRRDLS